MIVEIISTGTGVPSRFKWTVSKARRPFSWMVLMSELIAGAVPGWLISATDRRRISALV